MKPYNRTGLFTPATVFLCILGVILATFLFSNTDTILSKMGMETKTNLKGQLATTQGQLDRITEVNQQNAKNLALERRQTQALQTQLQQLQEIKKKAQEQVQQITHKKAVKAAAVTVALQDKTVEDTHSVTFPKAELDALSQLNIEQVHAVFDTLFPPPA